MGEIVRGRLPRGNDIVGGRLPRGNGIVRGSNKICERSKPPLTPGILTRAFYEFSYATSQKEMFLKRGVNQQP